MIRSRQLLLHISPPFVSSSLRRSSPSPHFICRRRSSVFLRAATSTPPSEVAPSPETEAEGPIEISSSGSTLFGTNDNPTTLQVSTSLLLTGALSIFLFRSLRRRAKRAKEMKVRSTGVSEANDRKEEALERLKEVSATSLVPRKPTSPIQAFLGSIAAGLICIVLYKFATTVEGSLNRQSMSDNYSVRQISITIRTIVNGLCYLATCVFGINSVGLFLLSLQLAIGSIFDNDSDSNKSSSMKDGEQLNLSEGSTNNVGRSGGDSSQTSDTTNTDSSNQ